MRPDIVPFPTFSPRLSWPVALEVDHRLDCYSPEIDHRNAIPLLGLRLYSLIHPSLQITQLLEHKVFSLLSSVATTTFVTLWWFLSLPNTLSIHRCCIFFLVLDLSSSVVLIFWVDQWVSHESRLDAFPIVQRTQSRVPSRSTGLLQNNNDSTLKLGETKPPWCWEVLNEQTYFFSGLNIPQ